MNEECFLLVIFSNHLMTSDVFFHWFTLVLLMMAWLILSKIVLLIFPMSDFEGFISRNESEFGKLSL